MEHAEIQEQLYSQAKDKLIAKEKELLKSWKSGKLQAIKAQVMKRGLVLSKQQTIQLCARMIEGEIFATLQSIGNDKAPGGQTPPVFSAPASQAPEVQHAATMAPRMDASLEIDLPGMPPDRDIDFCIEFEPGRKFQIIFLLAHELVKAYTRKNISPRSMLKIDLQKAYDSVECPFLEKVMVGLGFPDMFTQ
ncbi:uncharacterized protein [Solanum lycopersicum]|uniref:uncharacterized protein n=1 Tax=Solanum lycopersicum TaxID=4081 RepID=UPI003747D26C